MRPTKDEYFLKMAELVSMRATCSRRNVGCVLVDSRAHVLSTGYNGPASGQPHCIDIPCKGAACKSGTGLELCEAIHAEANALLQCPDVYRIETAYCTDSPCIHCVKLLLNTSCKSIVFLREYPHNESEYIWVKSGKLWKHITG